MIISKVSLDKRKKYLERELRFINKIIKLLEKDQPTKTLKKFPVEELIKFLKRKKTGAKFREIVEHMSQFDVKKNNVAVKLSTYKYFVRNKETKKWTYDASLSA